MAHLGGQATVAAESDESPEEDFGDELLRLLVTACHPVLSPEARAALTLRMICGLTTDEIARAYLLPEATIAQRIVRAKRTLSQSGLFYESPGRRQLNARLPSVLEVIGRIGSSTRGNPGSGQNSEATRRPGARPAGPGSS